ncbi:DUF1800 family protein [Acidisphaera sp. S103]|uniref:DUF1800 domain-containing protein n=1 Tax=Acidisphaera sp. S103 TaxID=1747223 RepID=UPI00131D1A55|nr:DUF1800 domain-containing protein [Acidisphaera sp. S103]
MASSDALHAFRRFGLGRRGTEPVPSDVPQWLRLQLSEPDPLLAEPGPTIGNAVRVDRDHWAARKLTAMPTEGLADLFLEDTTMLLRHAVTTDFPVRERLVWFWSNHFTVSERAGNRPLGLIGPYVRDAIRPHVTGKFVDMLKAVMRHPAMLYYLDNASSVGPNSPVGIKEHRGINENLGRECLELHTLGVGSGYTQRDVTAFSEILTGRTVSWDPDTAGFVFRADMHEPGPKMFMGHEYAEGLESSETALEWIARHPATRRHIATQMVRHYVNDVPPPTCVARVEKVLNDTDGDLQQAMFAIIDMDEAWVPLTKFRAPVEHIIAVQRALDLPEQPNNALFRASAVLGQKFMGPILPNGWPETADDWLSGGALLERADWAMTQASRPGAPAAERVAETTLGDHCSPSTRAAMKACPTPTEALATLFASPEFMRR